MNATKASASQPSSLNSGSSQEQKFIEFKQKLHESREVDFLSGYIKALGHTINTFEHQTISGVLDELRDIVAFLNK
jgi:hypothetical protein